MIITQFDAENILRLKAVHIKPNGSTVVIGGLNEQGKSSVLNSIVMALGGKGAIPAKPVRIGEDEGEICVEIQGERNLLVKRRVLEDGRTYLEVYERHAEGDVLLKKPQTILDALVGAISFDPLKFTRQRPADQVTMLQGAVGVDTTAVDNEIDRLMEIRKTCNREIRDLDGQFQACEHHPEVREKIDVQEQMDSLAELEAKKKAFSDHQSEVEDAQEAVDGRAKDLVAAEEELARAQERVRRMKEYKQRAEEILKTISESTPPDVSDEELDSVRERIRSAESQNKKFDSNQKREEIKKNKAKKDKDAKALTKKIDAQKRLRVKMLAEAKWPVKGLSFNRDGVTFKDMPFDQCSSAQRLEISTAIAMALNPKLRVMFIEDGSLLDEEHLKSIEKLVGDKGYQVWIERVGEGEECSVIIEDGTVKETR